MFFELIDQGILERTVGDRPVLRLNDASWEVLRGRREVRLPRRDVKRARRTRHDTESWEGVDRDLFERLRELRRELSGARGVPAYVIFTDATLRELARHRPRAIDGLAGIYGLGERKRADLGPLVIDEINRYLGLGEAPPAETASPPGRPSDRSSS
jgi:ATP-dependent DNA helicase RecQ